jgi:outer membrane protein TolC
MRDLDIQAEQIIREQAQHTLGKDGNRTPDVRPYISDSAVLGPSQSIYNIKPGTVNKSSDELTVSTATEQGTILDQNPTTIPAGTQPVLPTGDEKANDPSGAYTGKKSQGGAPGTATGAVGAPSSPSPNDSKPVPVPPIPANEYPVAAQSNGSPSTQPAATLPSGTAESAGKATFVKDDPNSATLTNTTDRPDDSRGSSSDTGSRLELLIATQQENVLLVGREMRLNDLLAYAIQFSPEYRTRKEDLFITTLQLLRERHLWGPRFFNDTSALFTGTPEPGDYDQALNLVNTTGVTQRLPYGGSVSAAALVGVVNKLHQSSSSTASLSQNASFVLNASIPLLRGAGMAAREDLIQSERNLVYATRTFERFRRDFFFRIATNYFDLIQQQSAIENVRRKIANVEWLQRRSAALANAGRMPYFEVQRAEQDVLFAKNSLIVALETYSRSIDNFKLTIGMPISEKIRIMPTEVVIPRPEVNLGESIKLALAYRLDLQNNSDQVEDSRRGIEVAKNRLLPDLNLTGTTTYRTDPTFDLAGVSFDPGYSSYAVGATFGAPLDRKIEEINYRSSLINYERAIRGFTLAKDRVEVDVRTSVRSIDLARMTLELQNRNISISQTRLDGVILRLQNLSTRDFIEAQDVLLAARNSRDAAVRNLRVNILSYLLNTDQLRVQPNGSWEPPAKLVNVTAPQDLVKPDMSDAATQNAAEPLPAPAAP